MLDRRVRVGIGKVVGVSLRLVLLVRARADAQRVVGFGASERRRARALGARGALAALAAGRRRGPRAEAHWAVLAGVAAQVLSQVLKLHGHEMEKIQSPWASVGCRPNAPPNFLVTRSTKAFRISIRIQWGRFKFVT